MRTPIATWCSIVAAALATSASASAEEFGTAGNFVFGAERLFGFYVDQQTIDTGPVEIDRDFTDFSLGWNASTSPLSVPRLTLDYLIDDAFTLGGMFGLYSRSADQGGNNYDETGVLFGVRVGYALRISHGVSFWPRGGFGYVTINGDGPGNDARLLSLGLEGMFTLAPAEGFAFLLGPTADLGVTGEQNDNDYSEVSFGIFCGLGGWFGG